MNDNRTTDNAAQPWTPAQDGVNRHDPAFCWEDITVDEVMRSGSYVITEDEIMAFARQFDPLPIHADRAAAAAGPFGVLTASGAHILALRLRLMGDFAFPGGVIAAVGYDEVRFLAPLRANQTYQVEIRFASKRPSASRPDRGIVTLAATLLADDQPIMTLTDTVLMRRRAEPG